MVNRKLSYGIIFSAFIAAIVFFSMYVFKFISMNDQVKILMAELYKSNNVNSNAVPLIIIIIAIIVMLLLFIISYVINNIILKVIKVTVESLKLAIGILVAYNFVFIISNILISYTDIRIAWITIIANLVELATLIILFSEELGKSKYKFTLIKICILVLNLVVSNFSSMKI